MLIELDMLRTISRRYAVFMRESDGLTDQIYRELRSVVKRRCETPLFHYELREEKLINALRALSMAAGAMADELEGLSKTHEGKNNDAV